MMNVLSQGKCLIDPKVESALKKARKRGITVEEARQQKLSYMMGMLGRDSSLTREDVKRILADSER